MADGGNEHFFFTRKIERELQVVGLVKLNCRMLLANLDYMFGEKEGVLLMNCSFSNVMVEWLKDVKVCPLDGDGVRSIGVAMG